MNEEYLTEYLENDPFYNTKEVILEVTEESKDKIVEIVKELFNGKEINSKNKDDMWEKGRKKIRRWKKSEKI